MVDMCHIHQYGPIGIYEKIIPHNVNHIKPTRLLNHYIINIIFIISY